MRLPLIAAVIGCLLTLPAAAQITPGTVTEGGAAWPATYPSWWYNAQDPANGVINATLPAFNQHNFAPLNQGQLWNLAAQAIQELDSQLATVGGANFSLADFSNGASPDYHAPANIGQLKHVSSHFFDRFAQVGFTPESPGWPETLILNTGPEDQAPNYPWLQNVTPSNVHIANLGQAKHLFSWDLSNWAPSNLDSDGDGLPDLWELTFGLNPDNSEDATQDADNDSLSNEDEFTIGTNPTNSDSDGDGWTDKQENDWGWDPNFDESQNGSPQIEPTTVVLDYDVDSIYKTYDGFYEPWTSTVNFDGPRTIVFNHSNTGHTLHTEYKYTSEYSNGTTYTKQYNEKVNYVPNNKFFRIINGNTKVIEYFLFEVDETHSSSIKLSISGSPCSFVMSYRNLVKKSFLVESWYDPAYNDETHDYFQTDATEENRVPNSPETLKTAIIEWTGEKILINGKVVNQGYDLKDLTGGNWEGRLLKVDLDIDATTPSASKLNFYVSDSIPISKATLLRGNENIGWLQEDEKLNLVGNGFLTFDQNSIGILEFDENNSQIDRDLKLELTIAGNIIELPIIADRVDHSKDAVELITGFWIDVGTRVFNHTIRETYSDYVYSVPASGKLRKLISSYASVNLGSSQFSAGTESHKYNPDGGPSQNMSTQSGLGDPNTVYWTNHSNLWIDKFETTINEGVCTNSGINVLTGTGSAFGGSTNNSVDVTID